MCPGCARDVPGMGRELCGPAREDRGGETAQSPRAERFCASPVTSCGARVARSSPGVSSEQQGLGTILTPAPSGAALCPTAIEFSLSTFGFLWKGKPPPLPSCVSVEFGFFAGTGDGQRGGGWGWFAFLTDHRHLRDPFLLLLTPHLCLRHPGPFRCKRELWAHPMNAALLVSFNDKNYSSWCTVNGCKII